MEAVDVVAAFDFDGTLSPRDNLVPFLRRVAGSRATLEAVAATTAKLGVRGRRRWTRNAAKEEVVRRLLRGRDAEAVDMVARAFADDILRQHLKKEAIERADWHRTQGHRLVIVSASLAVYLRPVAEQLRFDAVLATELEVADDGRLTGNLAGANVRGPEKPRRLDEWLGGSDAFVWAYGDSSGDRELWARADRSIRLGRRAHRGTA
jgi:HAD superfamily hydrolase (TIGR01490 family)